VNLDLELGTVVGEPHAGRDPVDEEELSNYNPYYDLGDDPRSEEDDPDGGGVYNDPDGISVSSDVEIKEEESADDDEEDREDLSSRKQPAKLHEEDLSSQKKPAKIYQPSSLLHLATHKVASNIEKYPPSAIGILSEYHWEGVIQARIAFNKRKEREASSRVQKGKNWVAFDGGPGRKMLPALAEKYLLPIERHPNNVHLARSKMADDLLWRGIVDYNFIGMNRPKSLGVPCGALKERLQGWGDKLVELMACPMSQEEFAETRKGKQPPLLKHGACQVVESGSKRKREEDMDDLFGEESDKEEPFDEPIVDDSPDPVKEMYQQYLEIQSNKRTNALRFLLDSLKQSPMDVTLLSETDVGKCASKAIKSMKKLTKQIENEDETEEALSGYPRFWKPVSWGEESHPRQRLQGYQSKDLVTSPFQLLQQILQDWKNMASDNGVEVAAPPAKKRRMEHEKPIAVATCGKDKKMSTNQHVIDMKLLHSSPDWRSLYQSLRKREGIMAKSHGEKARAVRLNLEKGRAKVGKVTLKKGVGRVRGTGNNAGQIFSGKIGAATPKSLAGPVRGTARKEAILDKSRGGRARQQQQLAQNSSARSSGGGGKMSQIRQESKVAASWSKGGMSVAKKVSHGTSVAKTGFGASVASAGSVGSTRKKPKQHMQLTLTNGKKQMKLPPSSLGGQGKTVGVFSSLQKKKTASLQQKKVGSKDNRKGSGSKDNRMGSRKR